jgi:hypothetical protein
LGSIPKTHPTLFHTIPIRILWVPGIPVIEFRSGQRMKGVLLRKIMNRFIYQDVKANGKAS